MERSAAQLKHIQIMYFSTLSSISQTFLSYVPAHRKVTLMQEFCECTFAAFLLHRISVPNGFFFTFFQAFTLTTFGPPTHMMFGRKSISTRNNNLTEYHFLKLQKLIAAIRDE